MNEENGMKVSDLRRLLSYIDQDLEVMSMVDEFVCFEEACVPNVEKIRLRRCDILDEENWEPADFVDDSEMLAEKTIVRV
jgi:hypothetical protein